MFELELSLLPVAASQLAARHLPGLSQLLDSKLLQKLFWPESPGQVEQKEIELLF